MRYFVGFTNRPEDTLAGFLQLTESEENLQDRLLKMPLNDVVTTITESPVQSIVKLSAQDPIIASYAKHARLMNYWAEMWVNSNVIHPKTKELLSMKPQKNIHPFDLVCGHIYYSQAIRVRNALNLIHSNQELQFLTVAEEHQSLHAVYELNIYNFKMIRRGINVEATIEAVITRSRSMIVPHKYLGYLVFAESHLCYAQYLFRQSTAQESLIFDCLETVEKSLAQALKIYPHSINEINNVFSDYKTYEELAEDYNNLVAIMNESEFDFRNRHGRSNIR